MTPPPNTALRNRAAAVVLMLGVLAAAGQWTAAIRPRSAALEGRRRALEAERTRLAGTRAELLRLGSEGIASRNRVLRAEVLRREALAPAGNADAVGVQVRERFAALAARYGVHAPSFEPVPVRAEGDLQVAGLKIRAAGEYHAIGTWLTEALADDRLLDVQRARLEAVPDSLTGALRGSPPPPAGGAPGAGPAPADPALQLAGAAPLDAVVEVVVQWYALPGKPGAQAASPSAEVR
ncbi:MAG TPA: hypothetical protein VFE05_10830 [Longimicrobiaceae bacterium]|nr:hypothetical protein [Longimicrobiaceae bacterium]